MDAWVVDEAFAYRLPGGLDDEAIAPLLCAGIWSSDVPPLDYAATLFQERRLVSVTANTRIDGETFLALALRLGVRATTVAYAMADANRALAGMKHGRFAGAAVLHA